MSANAALLETAFAVTRKYVMYDITILPKGGAPPLLDTS
jgi:hypothetical protein